MKLPNTIESCHVLIRELLKQVESLTILVEKQAVTIKEQAVIIKEVLRFSREADIPFTNNQAERDLRPAKGKVKVAGSFRSVHGAQHYARLQSVFSTWRKQGYNVFEELKTMTNGGKSAFLLNPT